MVSRAEPGLQSPAGTIWETVPRRQRRAASGRLGTALAGARRDCSSGHGIRRRSPCAGVRALGASLLLPCDGEQAGKLHVDELQRGRGVVERGVEQLGVLSG
jgi:hypothetical protein